MEIKGLRRRVTIGFMSIAGLLFLSGMLSFFELNTLSDDTDLILRANKRNMELSRSMLHSLQSQNYAFVQIIAFDDRSLDSMCLASVSELEQSIRDARAESGVDGILDSMVVSVTKLRAVSERLVAMPVTPITPINENIDTTITDSLIEAEPIVIIEDHIDNNFDDHAEDQNLYRDYQMIYNSMLNYIDSYLDASQNILAPRAESLHNNAYRAVTPVFISLVVMIVIVLLLYYFMLLYCVNPIVAMNKSLFDYLSFKIPFAPKCETRDEVNELRENIEMMIKQSKKQNN